MNKKGRGIASAMIAGIVLIAGVVLGYLIWGGNGDKPPDYAALLKDSAHYLKTVERKNVRLAEEAAALNTRIEKLREEIATEDADEQLTTFQTTIASLEEENTRLKGSDAENQRLLADNGKLEEALQASEAEITRLQEQMAALEAVQKDYQLLQTENEQIKEKLAEYISEKGVLEKQMASLHTRLDADDMLAKENALLKLTVETQEDKIAALSERLTEIEKMATVKSKGAPHAAPP
jgi:predicted nuclease with TOPRIM domain